MYRDNTTDNNYPKTLLIRNTVGGVRELVDHKPNEEETWPNWRETAQGIIEV